MLIFLVCTHHMPNDDRVLVAGSRDKTVKLWRKKGPAAWVVSHTLAGHSDGINCVTSLAPAAQSKDSALIVSGSRDKTLRLWVQDEGGG